MTRFSFTYRPEPHTVIAAHAFDAQIGKTVPITCGGQMLGQGTLVAVVVAEDQASAEMTVEVHETTQPAPRGPEAGA